MQLKKYETEIINKSYDYTKYKISKISILLDNFF